MQKRSTRHGFSSFFFQPSMDSGVTDAVDYAQLDELLAKQVQRPSCATLRWRAARELHQPCFAFSVELGSPRWTGLFFPLQRRFESFENAAFANAFDGRAPYVEVVDDLLVGQSLVRLQKDACPLHQSRRHSSSRQNLLQRRSFRGFEIHHVACHPRHGARIGRDGKGLEPQAPSSRGRNDATYAAAAPMGEDGTGRSEDRKV